MRQAHLDIARAVSILLVVMGHGPLAAHHPDWHHGLSNLRMPLLLMLAGMHLRPAADVWPTARQKADALLKPYLVMALLLGLYAWFKGEVPNPGRHLADVLSFNGVRMPRWLFPMWFLTLLWTLHVGVTALLRQHPHRLLARAECWALVGALGVLGYASLPSSGLGRLACSGVGLGYSGWFFNIDLWPLGAAWFLAGHLLAARWQDATPHLLHTLGWSALCAAIVLTWQPGLDMLMREADQPLASAAASWSGACAILGWSRLIHQHGGLVGRGLSTIGRYSLYILLGHAPLQSVMQGALGRLVPDQHELVSWLCVALVVAVCTEWGHLSQRHAALKALFEPLPRMRPRAPQALGRPTTGTSSASAASELQARPT